MVDKAFAYPIATWGEDAHPLVSSPLTLSFKKKGVRSI